MMNLLSCRSHQLSIGMRSVVVSALLVVFFATVSSSDASENETSSYSFDVSWAIKSKDVSSLLGDKQKLYDDYMSGCFDAVAEKQGMERAQISPECYIGENDRIKQAKFQPMSMQNYTKLGYTKIRAPQKIFSKIQDFWRKHYDQNVTEWHRINSYHNMWEAPPSIVNLQNASLEGGGGELMADIWDSSRELLEEWTGQSLVGCSLWGIRLYHDGSILAPHIDRLPLVASAIINIAQDVDEPWPLEVYGRDGKAVNITMEPGDMVLYESHSVIHGRPFPMKGNYFANVFIHFEPIGPVVPEGSKFSKDMLPDQARKSIDDGLPPYVVKGSPWAKEYKNGNPDGWKLSNTPIHAAARNDLATLRAHAWLDPEAFHMKDHNGWQAIHEAARHGRTEMIKLLVENGASTTEVSNFGKGFTPLQLCVKDMGKEHPACEYLKSAVAAQTKDDPESGEL
mmetsp:Transcript_12521/g.19374  ORF Transcript_12521/g.19374 Transcript_12521/m.19374 type:complete len:453 (+) Transcript_12521:134-1492(+)